MTWVVKTKPHWRRVHKCGHVLDECACSSGALNEPKRTVVLDYVCEDCVDTLEEIEWQEQYEAVMPLDRT